ncbi:UDP-2,3-diacylglucosamine diphosphatase [Radicibacter daui]|uniref:UDP-2,3-diacylglucosamine diphosphatase n=1 Tax=Radicibacter daui TaxID=3064829 RepID=UPI0040469D8C
MNAISGETWRFRTIWISDLHLGTKGSRAADLLEFLKKTESDTLYLVGDIVDGWRLRKNWYWPQSHNDVVQKLLRKARKGTRVVYIPGNHDEFARHFVENNFGVVEVKQDEMHITADGRKFLVCHGDEMDVVMRCAPWLAYLGDTAYTFALWLNRQYNRIRALMGQPYWSLSQHLKHKVKQAVSYIGQFEGGIADMARKRGAEGVICGHIHHAEMREIDGVLYCNDGDWVETCSALVEDYDGQLHLLHWMDIDQQAITLTLSAAASSPAPASSPVVSEPAL